MTGIRQKMLFAITSLIVLLAPVAHAQGQAETPKPSRFESWDDARLENYARGLLKEGRFYNRAIQAAQEVVKRNPRSLQAQLMLGCASVGRYASLGFALSEVDVYNFYQERYKEKLAAWKKSQEEQNPENLVSRPPVMPPMLVTPDDEEPFVLGADDAHRQMTALGRQAIRAFELARALDNTGTQEDRAQVELTRGWGLFLLRNYKEDVIQDGPVQKNSENGSSDKAVAPVYVSLKDVVDSFEQCTKLAPDDPSSWQSLALSLVPSRLMYKSTTSSQDSPDQAMQAIDKALSLKPRDFDLLYQAGVISTGSAPAHSVEYLNRALRRQGNNAVVWYLLSSALFKQAKQQPSDTEALRTKAIETMQQGNQAPLYQANTFALPVPAYLKHPWQYRPVYGSAHDSQIVASLIWQMRDVLTPAAAKQNETVFLSNAALLMKLGLKVVGSVDESIVASADAVGLTRIGARLSMGLGACGIAYESVRDASPARPSTEYRDRLEQYQSDITQLRAYDERIRHIIE